MNDTPRTDVNTERASVDFEIQIDLLIEVSRELERELNAANAELEELRKRQSLFAHHATKDGYDWFALLDELNELRKSPSIKWLDEVIKELSGDADSIAYAGIVPAPQGENQHESSNLYSELWMSQSQSYVDFYGTIYVKHGDIWVSFTYEVGI